MVCTEKLLDPTVPGPEAEELEGKLRARIVGQEEAIRQVVSAYQTFTAGLSAPGRPVANFLFLGPTGTGKTRMVEALAESLAGDARSVIKIDCAEFQHSHEIAKLIGSPPGYLGHRETHPALSQEAVNQYQTETLKISFVLFDEIEKASDALWNLLLGILDKATLTLGDNRQVDFSRAMIFMTSNLGAREMMSMLNPGAGFIAQTPKATEMSGQIEHAGIEAARRKFTPEFLNRIDKVIVFHPLGDAEMSRILEMELDGLRNRFRASDSVPHFDFSISAPARTYLLAQGTDLRSGARHLKRLLERELVHPLSSLLSSRQVRGGDVLRIDFDPQAGRLLFYRHASDVEQAQAAPAPLPPPDVMADTTAAVAGPRMVRASAARRK